MPVFIWPLLSYLAGSIPFGLLIGLARGIDIRKHGSGNIGATNAGRVLGRRIGLLCFALDVLKGFGPTLAFGLYSGSAGRFALAPEAWAWWLAVAAAAVLGHVFPVWLGFKGGKGVATGFGAMLGVFPLLTIAGALSMIVWIVSARVTRYVSVSSCLAAASLPAWTVVTGLAASRGTIEGVQWPCAGAALLLGVLVIWTHRGNLARVRAGTEPKIGARRTPPDGGAAGASSGATP
ncbi:MAG: glycerol-3-phosphate 1-O-acyltransferase PlsY [Phycisphaeraceae bacterium]|nr:glycerol-3-phosphate 1-O-acyltransferase PlsY [Phycisphaeraceae bacterium]